MDDAVLMGVRHCLRNPFQVSGGASGGQRLISDHFRQRAAWDQVHRKVLLTFVLADIVDSDNIRMLETGGGDRFGSKTLHGTLTVELGERQQLHRNQAIQVELSGLIDHAHASFAKLLQQLVIAEDLPP